MSVYESEIGRCFTGDFDLWIGDSPVEEPTRLQPREPIAGNFGPGCRGQCPARVRIASMMTSTGVSSTHGSRLIFIPRCRPMRGGTMSSATMTAMP